MSPSPEVVRFVAASLPKLPPLPLAPEPLPLLPLPLPPEPLPPEPLPPLPLPLPPLPLPLPPLPVPPTGMRSSPPPMTFAGPETRRYGTVNFKVHAPAWSFAANGMYSCSVLSVPPYLPVVNSAPAPALSCAHAPDVPNDRKRPIDSLLNCIAALLLLAN